jgi:hypothetical protein
MIPAIDHTIDTKTNRIFGQRACVSNGIDLIVCIITELLAALYSFKPESYPNAKRSPFPLIPVLILSLTPRPIPLLRSRISVVPRLLAPKKTHLILQSTKPPIYGVTNLGLFFRILAPRRKCNYASFLPPIPVSDRLAP